jgi:hypothetical protein
MKVFYSTGKRGQMKIWRYPDSTRTSSLMRCTRCGQVREVYAAEHPVWECRGRCGQSTDHEPLTKFETRMVEAARKAK